MSDDYALLIRDELAREASVTVGLRERSTIVVTTSSAFATLLAGGGLATTPSGSGIDLGTVSTIFGSLALAAFVLSAVLALVVNWPRRRVSGAAINDLRRIVNHEWNTPAAYASRFSAVFRVEQLASLREVNEWTNKYLRLAVIAEILAVVFAGVTAVSIVAWPG